MTLFHNNPGPVDTVRGVARRIGRNETEIEPGVSDLRELGILQSKTLGRLKGISFDRAKDREIQGSLVGYFKGLKS